MSLLILFHLPIGGASLEDRLRSWLGLQVTFAKPAVVLAQFAVACAFAVQTMRVTFDQIDPRPEQVALTLGCRRSQAFLQAFKNGPNCVKAAMGVVNASFTKMWKNSQGLLETRIGNLMDGAQWAGFSIAEVASYLATAEHETLGFSTMYETNWNSKKESNYDYFERMYGPNGDRSHLAQGMGNVTAGDGWHYRGRGYVNLTGKNIYNWANAQAMAGKLGPQFHQAYTVANDNINMYAEDHVLAGRIGALYLQYQWGVFNVQVTPGNFQAARQAVNPNEIAKVAKNVAGRASDFLAAIKNCK
jgi:hypothetical protein